MKKNFNIYDDASLLKKVLIGEATKEEILRAEELFKQHPKLKRQYDSMRTENSLKESFSNYGTYSDKNAYHLFLQKVRKNDQPVHRIHLRTWWYSAAAVALILVGLFTWQQTNKLNSVQKGQLAVSSSTGRQNSSPILSSNVKKNFSKQIQHFIPGSNTQHTSKSFLSNTSALSHEDDSVGDKLAYSKYVIPRGKEKTVKLSDGTTVHLNSASTLTYPEKFVGKQRVVMLQGEAYFDVTKDPDHPFIVQTRFGNVTVLGTAFDVNAYNDCDECYTTLVRGKVQFTTPANETVILAPGQQAVVAGMTVRKREVDVNNYISWMNGMYSFRNESLGKIMSTLERWYDIKVIFADPSIANLTYTGTVKRYDKVNAFLDIFEKAGDLTYRADGRNIYLYKSIKHMY